MTEKCIIERNRRHFNYTQGTPCILEPLKSLLGLESRITVENSVLEGTADLTQLPLTALKQLYFVELKEQKEPLKQKVNNTISSD